MLKYASLIVAIALAIFIALGFLLGLGMLMWVFERRAQPYFDKPASEADSLASATALMEQQP